MIGDCQIKELYSLVKFVGSTGPLIDTTYFPTVNNYYFTSTTYTVSPIAAMAVGFGYGNVSTAYLKTDRIYARPVRGGPQ